MKKRSGCFTYFVAVIATIVLATLLGWLMVQWIQGSQGTFTYSGEVVGLEYSMTSESVVNVTLKPSGDYPSYAVEPGGEVLELGDNVVIRCTTGPFTSKSFFRTHSCQLISITK